MDADRFDRIARRLGLGLSRRRLVGGVAAVTVGGAAPRPAPAAAQTALPTWPQCAPYPTCCVWIQHPGCGGCDGGSCSCDGCEGDEEDVYAMAAHEFSSTAIAGIAGAGTILVAAGAAHFTIFASRLADIPGLPPESAVPVARVQWRDPEANLVLESTKTDFYGPIESVEGGRGVLGLMRVNEEDAYPYVLRAVAAEPVGSGPETVSLRVGDAVNEDPTVGVEVQPTGFAYAAEGQLVAGDLQLLDIDMSEQLIQSTALAT